jgi:hypothetical protein
VVSLLQVHNNGTQRDIFRSVDSAAYGYSTRSEIRLVSERTQRGGLFATRLLMGVAEGPVLPVSQSLVAFESADGRRGYNMGVMQNFGSNLLGSFAAPLVLVAIAQFQRDASTSSALFVIKCLDRLKETASCR